MIHIVKITLAHIAKITLAHMPKQEKLVDINRSVASKMGQCFSD